MLLVSHKLNQKWWRHIYPKYSISIGPMENIPCYIKKNISPALKAFNRFCWIKIFFIIDSPRALNEEFTIFLYVCPPPTPIVIYNFVFGVPSPQIGPLLCAQSVNKREKSNHNSRLEPPNENSYPYPNCTRSNKLIKNG